MFFFFFQAEDGIRDWSVTGVQTCALPISNIGLPADPFAELGYQSWLGGLDIAKDDEMLADIPWCPLGERAVALGEARRRAERETGVPKIYLANITDEVDRLVELHDLAV